MFSRSILGEKNPMPTPMIHRAAGRELELAGPGARLRAEQAADIENETMKGRDFHFVRSGNKQFVGVETSSLLALRTKIWMVAREMTPIKRSNFFSK